jgi:NCS1 family nucleobase:cation symporter-1
VRLNWIDANINRLLPGGAARVAPQLNEPSDHSWAGPIAMVTGMVVSFRPFSYQRLYPGPVPKAVPEIGDVAPLVGFVLAGLPYLALRPLRPV